MKVLFVLEYYYPNVGGIEKLFKGLAESLVKEGHEVMILTNKFKKSISKDEIINNVRIKRLNLKNRFYFTFFSLPSIIKYGRRFDIIHTTSYNAALPAYLASLVLKKKVIITFHEVWGKLWFKLPFISLIEKSLYYLFEKLILALPFHKYVAVSDTTKKSLIVHGIHPHKISRIYNGIDYEEFINERVSPTNNFTFSFLGRLGISKGLDLLIPAAKRFIRDYPDSSFLMFTPNTPNKLFQKINKLVSLNNLNDNFIWHQNINTNQIKKLLLSSHCMVIPSYSEGFCFVAAETIAQNIPIISSNKTALSEVISGKFINMKSLDESGIYDALVLARKGIYEESTMIKYPFTQCIFEYLELYHTIEYN